ncbi:inositol-3-phosphate synthase [Saccharothrix variisporea]|uniref:inositol-3-phosphate synthase n=1 Tax=Saccharothrix variisporea TaxID=543527 RepID=UPI001B86FDC6|nr:inositol-3-phosphate synthase [Saccharothrix variisporea]
MWLNGGRGSVATTAITGLLALRAGLASPTGCVSELLDAPLPPWGAFTVGGHDITATPLVKRAESLTRDGVLPPDLVATLSDDLAAVDAEILPGYQPGDFSGSQAEAAARLAADIAAFRARHELARVVVVNVASTEPLASVSQGSLEELEEALRVPGQVVLPPSSLVAYAAFQAGCAFVDFTPSTGVALPALDELALGKGLPYAGRDGKTGETLLRAALAPMFTSRALRVLSWAGTNLLGGGDGSTLADPEHAKSKSVSKARGLAALLGEDVSAPLHIDYVPDLGERKTAWDHVSFEGFLGARMSLQLTWSGLDSSLAAPLVLDLARLLAAAHSAGRVGVQAELGFFFKDPLGSDEHRLAEQAQALREWARSLR